MDRDTKIKMLLDMQEQPRHYSEAALQQMLGDDEAHELMEAAAQLKRAMENDETTMSVQDVDEAWQAFAATHFPTQQPQRNWLKTAATFVGILFVTGITFAAIRTLTRSSGDEAAAPPTAPTEKAVTAAPAAALPADTLALGDTAVVFDNVTLDSMARAIAAYHRLELVTEGEQPRRLRFYFVWNPSDSLQEVVEKLNMFEHVNMTVEDGKLMVR